MNPAVVTGIRYTVAATAVAVLIGAVAGLLADPTEWSAVVVGAGLALVVQVAVFWLLAAVFFPTRRMLLVGVGMAVRMLVLLLAALFAPQFGFTLAPVLLTLVSVFVLTTLLEPVVFQLEIKSAS
jgi:hypothetical protein